MSDVFTIVSEPALFRRVARRLLREESLILHRCSRRSQWWRDLGDYYCVDFRNHAAGQVIGNGSKALEQYARQLGVLSPSEMVSVAA